MSEVLVLGSGFAGLWAALGAARRLDELGAAPGDVTVTVQNLDVVRVDEARGLLMIKGAVPGAKNGFVTVRLAAKGQPKPVAAPTAKAEKGKK